MTDLTRRQRQIVDFIRTEIQAGRPSPTLREIARHFGFRAHRAAACHIAALKRKGVVKSELGKARSLVVTSSLQRLRARIVDIPLYGSVPAGFAQNREQEPVGCVSVDVESIGFKPSGATFALHVTGDSMIGRHIVPGDIALVDRSPEPRDGQVVSALIDGEVTLKTFMHSDGKPYLKAENPKYPDLIPARELMIQGVLRALIRKGAK